MIRLAVVAVLTAVGLGVSWLAPGAEAQLSFFPLTPCRIVDTRNGVGPTGGPALVGGAARSFPVTGNCGVPAQAEAVASNFTVLGATSGGFLTVFPSDTAQPVAALLQFGPGQSSVVSNSANMAVSQTDGTITAFVSNTGGAVHFILNVYGYFGPAGP